MRHKGVKLAADVVLVRQPYRGWLIIRPESRQVSQDGRREGYIGATLQVNDGMGGPTALPCLSDVWIRRWEGRHLILVGREYAPGSGVPGVLWPQAWWVRLLESRNAPWPKPGSPHSVSEAAPGQ
jgi:hypothetical protein